MANCLEITLWYPEDKFNALSTALEPAGSSVEEELGRVLTELYERLVPSEQRVEIAEKLAREEQHEAEERVREHPLIRLPNGTYYIFEAGNYSDGLQITFS